MPVSVVAAVHDPAGETAATNRLRALTAQVGGGPKVIVARGDTAVAAWGPRAGAGTGRGFGGRVDSRAAEWGFGGLAGAERVDVRRACDGVQGRAGPVSRSFRREVAVLRDTARASGCCVLAPRPSRRGGEPRLARSRRSCLVLRRHAAARPRCHMLPRNSARRSMRDRPFLRRYEADVPHTSHDPIDSFRPPDELAEALVDQLARTIDWIVGPVSRIAVLGGGGVDSSGLLGTLVHRTRASRTARVSAVTFDFAGPGDDRPHFRTVTDSLGVEALRVYPSDASALVKETFVIDAAPFEWQQGALDLCAAERGRAWGADVLIERYHGRRST